MAETEINEVKILIAGMSKDISSIQSDVEEIKLDNKEHRKTHIEISSNFIRGNNRVSNLEKIIGDNRFGIIKQQNDIMESFNNIVKRNKTYIITMLIIAISILAMSTAFVVSMMEYKQQEKKLEKKLSDMK